MAFLAALVADLFRATGLQVVRGTTQGARFSLKTLVAVVTLLVTLEAPPDQDVLFKEPATFRDSVWFQIDCATSWNDEGLVVLSLVCDSVVVGDLGTGVIAFDRVHGEQLGFVFGLSCRACALCGSCVHRAKTVKHGLRLCESAQKFRGEVYLLEIADLRGHYFCCRRHEKLN